MMNNESVEAPDPHDFRHPSPSPASDATLAVLCGALQSQGVERIVIRYAGSGDSGAIEHIEYEPESAAPGKTVEDHLCDVAEDYCPAGYQNNEGGYGTLTIYPGQGLAELEHSNRFEDTEAVSIEAAQLPQTLRQRLAQLGVALVSARFDGFGDEGLVEEVTAQPDSVVLDTGVEEELENFLFDQLPEGWENNEGGYGEFTVEVPTGRVTVDAYWRIEEDSDPHITRWRWRQ